MHPLEEKEEKTRKKKWMRTRDIEKKPNYYKRYKLHPCPYCRKSHRSIGPYCSQSCSSKNKQVSDQARLNYAKARLNYNNTPEGIVTKRKRYTGIDQNNYYITIPEV